MKRIGLKELSVGGVWTLPDGVGSITFQGWERWVNLQVVRDPGKGVALTGAILAILGLLATLFVKRRRIWVRARLGEDGATVISIAGLTRQEYEGFEAEMNDFWDAITGRS
jgi:cytochrome c biogenesis protein